uniref:Uncharacterized protein n=1 Tax=Solanum lycopersicum TaxID=4081 RepID=K4CDX4_SOLLC
MPCWRIIYRDYPWVESRQLLMAWKESWARSSSLREAYSPFPSSQIFAFVSVYSIISSIVPIRLCFRKSNRSQFIQQDLFGSDLPAIGLRNKELSKGQEIDKRTWPKERSIQFSMEMEFCEFSPELEDHFEIFKHIRGFNVTIVTSANTQDETLPPCSGFLQKEEKVITQPL